MANKNVRMKQIKANKKTNKNVDEVDIKGFIIIVIAILIVTVLAYGLTLLAKNIGLFNERYIKPEVSNATISYENILSGTVFGKQESEYYVLLADLEDNESVYLSSLELLYSEKSDKLPLYLVNLNEGLNKSIISETSNPSAQSAADLKVNGHTLIKISGGRNVKYVEGDENIKVELGI